MKAVRLKYWFNTNLTPVQNYVLIEILVWETSCMERWPQQQLNMSSPAGFHSRLSSLKTYFKDEKVTSLKETQKLSEKFKKKQRQIHPLIHL